MKKNILVKVGERTEEKTVLVPAVYDDDGNIVTEEHEETITEEVPVMEAQTVDMTEEEEQAYLAEQENMPENEPTAEERIAELEQAIRILLGGDTDE